VCVYIGACSCVCVCAVYAHMRECTSMCVHACCVCAHTFMHGICALCVSARERERERERER